MEDVLPLVVLTLLQLCRAEITNTEWYAANLINDPSYTPKPLTEIFTTNLTFIPKDPSVSAQIPPLTSTPIIPTSTITTPDATLENRNTTMQQNLPQRIPLQILGLPQQPQVISQPIDARNEILGLPQQPQVISQPIDARNDLPSFVFVFDPRQQTSQINQQPLNTPTPATPASLSTSTAPPTTTRSTTQATTIVPRNIQPQVIPLAPPIGSTGFNPGRWDIRNIVFPLPNFPITNNPCNITQNPVGVSSTQVPQTIIPVSGKPVLTVRVKAPKGSITNIRINPTTTTRRPTTRRRNNRKNDYEICLNSCKGRKEPICSSPVGIFPIDSDKLKGFASLCHMACHNSYKNDQGYNKVADGRCGRLRTRIRPVDKDKLNREELNKAQYTITHNAPETILHFSPLKH